MLRERRSNVITQNTQNKVRQKKMEGKKVSTFKKDVTKHCLKENFLKYKDAQFKGDGIRYTILTLLKRETGVQDKDTQYYHLCLPLYSKCQTEQFGKTKK